MNRLGSVPNWYPGSRYRSFHICAWSKGSVTAGLCRTRPARQARRDPKSRRARRSPDGPPFARSIAAVGGAAGRSADRLAPGLASRPWPSVTAPWPPDCPRLPRRRRGAGGVSAPPGRHAAAGPIRWDDPQPRLTAPSCLRAHGNPTTRRDVSHRRRCGDWISEAALLGSHFGHDAARVHEKPANEPLRFAFARRRSSVRSRHPPSLRKREIALTERYLGRSSTPRWPGDRRRHP
jgi:hypothetical protein